MEGERGTLGAEKSKNDGMEARTARLKDRLERLLREAANVEVELSRADGTIRGVPHYSVIEGWAHELGKQLSRKVQRQQLNELAAAHQETAACPTCKTRCPLTTRKRPVKTVDGDTELQELEGYCNRCRRSFFPSS
jgi:hypothetical protein